VHDVEVTAHGPTPSDTDLQEQGSASLTGQLLLFLLETLEERREPELRQLIDPGIGTVLASVAAVSSGLIPPPLKMSASSLTGYFTGAVVCKVCERSATRIDLGAQPGYLACHMSSGCMTGTTTTTARPCDSTV
jgi:hypothetical protein